MIKNLIKKLAIKFLNKEDLRALIHKEDKEFIARAALSNFEIENSLYAIIERIATETEKDNPNKHAFRMCVAKVLSDYDSKDKRWLDIFISSSSFLDKSILENAVLNKDGKPEEHLQFIYNELRRKFLPEPKVKE